MGNAQRTVIYFHDFSLEFNSYHQRVMQDFLHAVSLTNISCVLQAMPCIYRTEMTTKVSLCNSIRGTCTNTSRAKTAE